MTFTTLQIAVAAVFETSNNQVKSLYTITHWNKWVHWLDWIMWSGVGSFLLSLSKLVPRVACTQFVDLSCQPWLLLPPSWLKMLYGNCCPSNAFAFSPSGLSGLLLPLPMGRADILPTTLDLQCRISICSLSGVLVSVFWVLFLFSGCLFSLTRKDEFCDHLLLQFGKLSPLKPFLWASAGKFMLPSDKCGFSSSLWFLVQAPNILTAVVSWLWTRRCDLEEVTFSPSQLPQVQWMRATQDRPVSAQDACDICQLQVHSHTGVACTLSS